jgi:hypothetical protein
MKKTYSVYVVELDKAILERRRFVQANPNYNSKKACLYVGMTGLSPDERFANHKSGHKASRYVREFGKYLRRRLYEKYNPMTCKEAEKMEVELAVQLRAKGYAVWQK